MKIPDESKKNIQRELVSNTLLTDKLAEEVIDSLESEKDVNWNIVLNSQFESEKGGEHETQS